MTARFKNGVDTTHPRSLDGRPVATPGPEATIDTQPRHYWDLATARHEAFARFDQGVHDRRSAFRTPLLVTRASSGFPAVRTVVLRGFDAATRKLAIHTDRRSDKVSEIAADPRIALCVYDAAAKIQVRVSGYAAVHWDDAVAERAWQRLTVFGRRCYLGMAPGVASPAPTSGLATALERHAPSLSASEEGFTNFAVIEATICRLEWLYLAAHGHRRAAFEWDDRGRENAGWLTP